MEIVLTDKDLDKEEHAEIKSETSIKDSNQTK